MTKLAVLYPLCVDKISDIVSRCNSIYTSPNGSRYTMLEVVCPCCNRRSVLFVQAYVNDNDIIIHYDSVLRDCFNKFFSHIEHKIRYHGDVVHIDLLVKLFGRDKSLELLSVWAEKNIFIAETLKNYVLQLESKNNDVVMLS